MDGVGASIPRSANGDTRSESINQVTGTGSGRGMLGALGVRHGVCSQDRSKGPGTFAPPSRSASTPPPSTATSVASAQVAALSAIEPQPTATAAATATTRRMEQVLAMVRVAIERRAPFILSMGAQSAQEDSGHPWRRDPRGEHSYAAAEGGATGPATRQVGAANPLILRFDRRRHRDGTHGSPSGDLVEGLVETSSRMIMITIVRFDRARSLPRHLAAPRSVPLDGASRFGGRRGQRGELPGAVVRGVLLGGEPS